jgi:hypothetical protein
VEYLQPVPAVYNTQAWIDALLPTLRRVVGEDKVMTMPPALGYDDVSVFVNTFGGAYVVFGVQDIDLVVDHIEPIPGAGDWR